VERKGRGRGGKGEGRKGGREGPVKSVKPRALNVASPPLRVDRTVFVAAV